MSSEDTEQNNLCIRNEVLAHHDGKLQEERHSCQNELSGWQEVSEQLTKEKEELQRERDKYRQKLHHLRDEYDKLVRIQRELEHSRNKCQSHLLKWRQSYITLHDENERRMKELTTLKQWTLSHQRCDLEKEQLEGTKNAELVSCRKQLLQLQKRTDELVKKRDSLLEEISSKEQVIVGLRKKIEKMAQKKEQRSGMLPRSPKVNPALEMDQTGFQSSQARIEELEAENYKLTQQIKEKNEQIRQFNEFLTSQKQRSSPKGKGSHDQLTLGQMYVSVEGEGTQQHRKVTSKLHELSDHIDDLVAEVDSEANPLQKVAMLISDSYNDVNLGYRILFCSLLQMCYNICKWALTHRVTRDAVEHWQKDVPQFSRDVTIMLQDSMADELHELETIAPSLVSAVFNTLPVSDKDLKQYTAVYKLVTEYLTAYSQDYIYPQEVLEEMKKIPQYEHVTADPDVEHFLKTIAPLCWELVTIYKPPIFVSGPSSNDRICVINGALHEKHPESRGKSNIIHGFLFPLVYKDYGGGIEQKARVIMKMSPT